MKDLQYSKNTNIGKNRQSVAAVTGIVQDDASSGVHPESPTNIKRNFFNSEENMQLKPPPAINSEPTPLIIQSQKVLYFHQLMQKTTKGEIRNKQRVLEGVMIIKFFFHHHHPLETIRLKWHRHHYHQHFQMIKMQREELGKSMRKVIIADFTFGVQILLGNLVLMRRKFIVPSHRKIKMMIGAQRSVEIACVGDKHTFCLTKNKKMYLTGSGNEGQLVVGK